MKEIKQLISYFLTRIRSVSSSQLFFSMILILMFFGLGGQKAIAAEEKNIIDWKWSGKESCWDNTAQYNKKITLKITDEMLTGGKFLANVSGFSEKGHTFMYFYPEDDTVEKENLITKNCYKNRDPIPTETNWIFNTFSDKSEKSSQPVVEHDFGALTIGKKYVVSCWGFAADSSESENGNGGCGFGLIPSCTLSASPADKSCVSSNASSAIGIPVDGSFKICWNTKNATDIEINNDITESLDPISGTMSIVSSKSGNITYVMTVKGATSSNTCKTTVSVGQPTCIFSAVPPNISYGDKAMLKWETVGVTSASMDNGNDNVGDDSVIEPSNLFKGSAFVAPLINTTYKMTATGPNGPVDCPKATVTVSVPPPQDSGLIPCGRLIDNINTPEINETAACNICSVFYMMKSTINFIMSMSIGIGIFVFVLVGLLYVLSGGSLERISLAKTAMGSVISGISVIFIVWVGMAIILQAFGYGNMSKWNQVSCGLTATPSQVNDLALTQGDNQNILSWTAPAVNSGVTHYHIYRSTASEFTITPSNLVSDDGKNVTFANPTYTFVDTGLEQGTTYYYKVLAVNDIGEGNQPSEVSTMFDCSGSDGNTYLSMRVATDADHDGYSATPPFQQCVGASQIFNGRTYYKNSEGNYYLIASPLGAGDCADTNPDIWRNRYLDSDNDEYCTTPKDAPICVGTDEKYPHYKDSCKCFTNTDENAKTNSDITKEGDSACYYRDCAPTDSTSWRNRRLDFDGDSYGDEFINIYGTDKVTKYLGPLFCVGAHPSYVDTAPDCKPNNKWIYQLKSVVKDSDQDGYSITDKDRYGKIISSLLIPIDPELIPAAPKATKSGDAEIPPLTLVPGCVGDLASPPVKNTNNTDRQYYRNEKEPASGGGFFYVDSTDGKSWLNKNGETDCDPNNTNIYRKRDVATDTDHDGFPVTAVTEQCVGDSKSIEGIDGIKRTYYKKTSGNVESDFIYIDKSSVNKYPVCQGKEISGTTVCSGIGGSCSSSSCGSGCSGNPVAIGPCGCIAQCITTGDCNDKNAIIYQNQNVATDEDQDGHSTADPTTQCVGSSTFVDGRIYFKNSIGAFDRILSGSIITKNDCADSNIAGNKNIHQLLNVTTDADHDNYSALTVSPASMCVGDPSVFKSRTYYKNSAGAYPFMMSAPAGIDCDDSTDDKWRKRYADTDKDTYGADGLICVGSDSNYPNYVDNNTDCNNSDEYIYQTLTVATDADHDNYSTSSATSQCVGNPKIFSARTYYKKSLDFYPYISSVTAGTSDCNDSDSVLHAMLPYYCDGDNDTFKSKAVSGSICSLSVPGGCSDAAGSDCNDGNFGIKPGVAETCDSVDDNCNVILNDGVAPVSCTGGCDKSGTKSCNASGVWGVCSTASFCDNDPLCNPLSQTTISGCPLGKAKTQNRSQVCCGGCSGWSAWGECK